MIKKFFSVGIAAILIQCVGAIFGVLAARWMTKSDYAVYSVYIVFVGAMAVLTKAGTNIGMTATAGKYWDDKPRARNAFIFCQKVRGRFSIWVVPLVAIFSAYIFLKVGGSLIVAAITTTALLFFWVVDMKTRLTEIALQLNGQQLNLQYAELAASFIRLLGIGFLFFAEIIDLTAVLAVVVVAQCVRWLIIKKMVIKNVSWLVQRVVNKNNKSEWLDDESAISSITKRQYPIELYYCIQAQVLSWFLVSLGGVDVTADYGALSRVAQVLMPLTVVINMFLVPMIARAGDNLKLKYFQSVLIAFLGPAALFLFVWATPGIFLSIIGSQYKGLESELLKVSGGAAVAAFASVLWQVTAARGWNSKAWIQMPFYITVLILSVSFCIDRNGVFEVGDAVVLQLIHPMGLILASGICAWHGLSKEFKSAQTKS